MIGVNVLPASYVHSRRRASRIRRWLVVVLVAGVTFSIPVGFGAFKSAQASELQSEAEPLRARLSTTKKRLAGCQGRVTSLQQQLARADALRGKRDWRGLLTSLMSITPDEVWLTSLESVRESNRAGGGNSTAKLAGGGKLTHVELKGPSGLRITGYALEHHHFLAFWQTLNQSGLFDHVDPIKADEQKMHDSSAVRFVLECAW